MKPEQAPRLKIQSIPEMTPHGFRRADWALESVGKFLFEIDEYVRGPAPVLYFQDSGSPKVSDVGEFRTIVLPMVAYESLVRRANAYESVRASIDAVCDVAWRAEMNRLNALDELDKLKGKR